MDVGVLDALLTRWFFGFAVIFKQELDLSKMCVDIKKDEESLALYELQSIVVHAGEYGSGHYYAYVRPDVSSNQWYRFNDHIVTKVRYRDVENDAFGEKSSQQEKSGFWSFLRADNSFGWGGRTSSAYVLQYVKTNDIPKLYN